MTDAVHRLKKMLEFKTAYKVFIELSGFDAKILIQGIPL
ncbi:hypothetical protein MNB_SV-12-1386 [hydrothermal vent metagenome]|uniref:Uncharacterized protein n=1 Tax=hydrothermal vent metagenome TaxID=652676 RepID=A0A1W1BZ70_9ZZZZ